VSARYLLPCPCGKKIPVDTAQAGQVVSCDCGRRIEVPTLLRLRLLETVDEERQSAAPRRWGVPQGLTIVGAAVMLAAAAGLLVCYLYRPPAPEAVFTQQNVDRGIGNLTLLQAEGVWQQLSFGLAYSRPIDPTYRRALKTYWVSKYATVGEAYRGALKQYRIRMGIGLVVLLVGAALTATGLVMTFRRRVSVVNSSLGIDGE
jgi:hypothetical protein